MRIWMDKGLINEKSIDILVDVARRSAPNGWKLNEDMARDICLQVLKRDGICIYRTFTSCPDGCKNYGDCPCEMYVPSK